jgi:hypothetical protein
MVGGPNRRERTGQSRCSALWDVYPQISEVAE